MSKVISKIFLIFILSFTVLINANAECSYKERKKLLDDAKKVEISVEPILNDNRNYTFKFTMINLTENIFVKYYNLNNGNENIVKYTDTKDGIYSFIDEDIYSIYDYNFTFYADTDNCYAKEISSKTIKKPMYNIYSENVNCTYDNNADFEYCKKFLYTDNKLTIDKFNDELIKYNQKNRDDAKEKEKIKENKNFKYIIIATVLIILVIGMLIIIRKKSKNKKRR